MFFVSDAERRHIQGEPGVLGCNDVAQEVAELKKRGVQFEHYDAPEMKREGDIHTGGGARAAWFKDSEGNILAVIQSE